MNSLIYYAIILVVSPFMGYKVNFRQHQKRYLLYKSITKVKRTKSSFEIHAQTITIIFYMCQFTWYEAFIECSYRDMCLLTIDSKQQYDDILALLIGGTFTQEPPQLWVGAIDNGKKFEWIYTGNAIKPSLWYNGCPNAVNGCIKIWDKHGLNNDGCSNKIGFVCEKRVQPEDCCSNGSNITLNCIQNNKCTK